MRFFDSRAQLKASTKGQNAGSEVECYKIPYQELQGVSSVLS